MYFYEGCTIKEIQAMRDLQNEPFDFGTGLITVDCKESEDIYMKMHLQMFYDWNYYDDSDDDVETDTFIKDRTRAKRRKNNWKKAINKRKYGYMHQYDKPLNSLNKGKNFCSCSLCTPKTNPKGKRYYGSQKIKYKQRNWKHSDRKKIDMTTSKLKDNYNEWSYLDYADYEYRQWSLLEDWDCYRFYEEYLAKIKLYKEQEKLWNEEYEKNKDWYDGHDDY